MKNTANTVICIDTNSIIMDILSHNSQKVSSLVFKIEQEVGLWSHRARSRRHLSRLDRHLLNDIGLSAGDAAAETGKAFWRA